MNKIILASILILTLAITSFVNLPKADALVAPTITDTGSLTGGPSSQFQQVWTNSTHAFFFSNPASGSFNRWHYTFSTDTLSAMGSTNVNNGGVVCDTDVFISPVQTDNTIYAYCKDSGTANVVVANYNINSLTKNNGTNYAIASSDVNAFPADIVLSQNKIYTILMDENGASNDRMCVGHMYRTYASYTENCSSNILQSNAARMTAVVESGSPDEIYVYYNHDEAEGRIAKWTLSGGFSNSGTDILDDWGLAERSHVNQTPDTVYVQTTESRFYSIDKATLSTTLLTSAGYTGWAKQHITISNATFSFVNDDDGIYVANTTTAIGYNPSTGTKTPAGLFVETVTNSTGTITGINEAKFYKLSDSVIISAPTTTGTTWTIREFSSTNTVSASGYSETLGAPLLLDNDDIFGANVIRLVCDAVYSVTNPIIIVGNDSDCTIWRVLATSSATVGREVFPYTRTIDGLVHTPVFTGYTYQVAVSNPTSHILKSKYGGEIVDMGYLGADGTLQQRYLYGQCYSIEDFNTLNNVTTILGNVCANDITTKSISLNGVTIPDGWEGTSWAYAHSRDFTNATNNVVIFILHHSETPWNASILFTDHIFESERTFIAWRNITNAVGDTLTIVPTHVNGSSTLYINNNQTIFVTVYSNGMVVANDQIAGRYIPIVNPFDASLGTIFGINGAGVFLILLGALFTRSNANFGIVVMLAAAGIMGIYNMLTLPEYAWATLIAFGAIGVFLVARRF